MWSKLDSNSDNDINYLVNDRFLGGKCRPTNAVKILEISFVPDSVKSVDEIIKYPFGICIFKDAKRVLSEDEIIDEVHRSKVPFAKFLDKKVYEI